MLTISGQTISLTRADTARLQPVPVVESTGMLYEFSEGDRVVFRLRKLPDRGTVLEKDCTIDLETNQAVVKLIPEDTENKSMSEYRYEFELVTADDEHYTFIENQKFIIGKELETHD